MAFDWRVRVPESFAVYAIDEALLVGSTVEVPNDIPEWIEHNWGTRDNFLTHGFGSVTAALNTNQIVSWSICDCIADNTCEIGIRTHPEYRQRGLAALTTAATVDYALTHGFSTVGWHCNADNIASQRTALQSGFTLERECLTFVSFRLEAVHWAEAGRLQEVAGNYQAAAAYYVRANACEDKPTWGHYLPYYAACMFSKVGDHASAWTWLHHAVEHGFTDVDALQSDDSLTPMKGTAAWDNLIESIRSN